MEYSKELIEKASECKSKEELEKLAKENNIELDEKEVDKYFDAISKKGELNDEELNSVSGGSCSGDKTPKFYVGERVQTLVLDGFTCSTKTGEIMSYELETGFLTASVFKYRIKIIETGEEVEKYECDIEPLS